MRSNRQFGTRPSLFSCLSFLTFVFFVCSNSRGTNVSRHDLLEGDFVDVRTMILEQNHDVTAESVSPVFFCFVSSRAPLRDSVAMAATVETSAASAAGAATAEDEVPTASGRSSSVPSAPGTPVATPKALAAGGRIRGEKKKPQIDIDYEIQEANKLAELFKKMQKASKVAGRNAVRQRQRLVRKAQKLSEQDLMRLAVIKRCGMFVPDVSAVTASSRWWIASGEEVEDSGTPLQSFQGTGLRCGRCG